MKVAKKEIHDQCLGVASNKQNEITTAISRIRESLLSESKSTAGDKHETGRAMLQLEREKLGLQLKNNESIYTILKKIDPTKNTQKIALGSLVKTDQRIYYLSVSLGKIIVKETPVFAISPITPIGKLLLGKTQGDTFIFNGKSQTIVEVY